MSKPNTAPCENASVAALGKDRDGSTDNEYAEHPKKSD